MNPAAIMQRLEEIERDLAAREPALDSAARKWTVAKRDLEHARAVEFMKAQGSVEQRKMEAVVQTEGLGKAEEAEFEALRAVVRVLETRSSIGQSLLKAVGRGA